MLPVTPAIHHGRGGQSCTEDLNALFGIEFHSFFEQYTGFGNGQRSANVHRILFDLKSLLSMEQKGAH